MGQTNETKQQNKQQQNKIKEKEIERRGEKKEERKGKKKKGNYTSFIHSFIEQLFENLLCTRHRFRFQENISNPNRQPSLHVFLGLTNYRGKTGSKHNQQVCYIKYCKCYGSSGRTPECFGGVGVANLN